jgi:hypothetical protein
VTISSSIVAPAVAQSIAQSSESTTPNLCPIDLTLLQADRPKHIITADTISPTGTTLPSLWWTSEQFPRKLVTNWIANSQTKEIYLLVNLQYWNLLDYLDRYRTIDRFGQAARNYGYNYVRLCTSQKTPLARYTCSANASDKAIASCQISLDSDGQNGLRVNR